MINSKKISLDWWIVGALTILFLGGLVTMTSFVSEQAFFQKQLLWVCIAVCIGYGVSRFDMRFLRQSRFLIILFGVSVLMLVSVLLFGKTIKGAQSWIDFGGFSFQPTDIAKLVLILVLAKYFSRRHIHIEHIRHLFISFAYTGILVFLVLLQPDFGSAMVFGFIWLGMAILAGISKKHLILLGVIGVTLGAIAWIFSFQEYQKKRIISFIQPMSDIRGSGYNAYQSMVAVGSGGLLGKGVGYGTQSRLNFLPEYQTDFIFAALS